MSNSAQEYWLSNLEHANNYNQWIFGQLSTNLAGDILEVGCGTGNFTVYFAQHCQHVVGLDLNEEFIATAKIRISGYSSAEVVQGDLREFKWPTLFDTVVMLDVLEHIQDDLDALRTVATNLKPGGKVILKVPAFECLYGPMDQAIGHFRRYNDSSLKKVLLEAGFILHSIWYFNVLGIAGWWFNSRVMKRTVPPVEQVSLFENLIKLLAPLESILSLPVGLSLFAVAEKSICSKHIHMSL